MSQSEQYWDDILPRISASQNEKEREFRMCTPIIGERASSPWIPSTSDIATKWAKDNRYPLKDSSQLSRVAQFLAVDNADELVPKLALSRELGNIVPPDFDTTEMQDTVYSVLAGLNLPIYITTNYDLFMEAALKAKGKSPVSEFCRWNKDLIDELKRVGIPSVFDEGSKYTPKPESPLVYHLYGVYRLNGEYRPDRKDIDLPQSLVLTEKDYIDFAIALAKAGEQAIFPDNILRALYVASLLFIGFSLDDLSFRIIFQGVINSRAQLRTAKSVIAIQLPPESNLDPVQAKEYLKKYTQHMFKVHVYWGDPSNFSKDLRERWENFKRSQSASKR